MKVKCTGERSFSLRGAIMQLRQAIEIAISRSKVPPFDPKSIRSIASALHMAAPISARKVLQRLGSLPAATVTLSSGPLTANHVHGWAQIGLQSNGLTSFRGQVHESGAVGDNYLMTAVLIDVKDSSGGSVAFAHSGTVAGQVDLLRHSDDDWQTDRAVELIEAQWETARNSRVEWRLHASTDPIELGTAPIPIPGSGYLIGLLLESGSGGDEGDGTSCSWASDGLANCRRS